MKSETIAKPVLELCRDIAEAGGRAVLVGGWVRDQLRGEQSADYDLEVYELEADRLKSLLAAHGTVNAVGESFTVYKVRLADESVTEKEKSATDPALSAQHSALVVDVSLPRRESKTGRGHRAFAVIGDPQMSFTEAARRRDFTINAIMYDPLTGEFIDPFDGRSDIESGIIRAVDPATFVEDSLRVLRAMQFAARFAYEIAPTTVSLCRGIDLSDLPHERIMAEVEKWLLKARRPSLGWQAARDLGIVEKLWPECQALIDCPQDPAWHPEGDVWLHTGLVLDEARKLIDDLPRAKQLAVMLGALCHDFGKPATTKFAEGRIRSRGHEEAGVVPTENFLARLNIHTTDGYDVRAQVKALVQYHLSPAHFFKTHEKGEKVSDGAFRRLAQKVEPDLLYRVAKADCLGRTGDFSTAAMDWFIMRVNELDVTVRPPEPILKGRHVLALGLLPGPRIGRVTRTVYELQLDGKVTTLADAIATAKEIIARNEAG